jgi:hypothetical protein
MLVFDRFKLDDCPPCSIANSGDSQLRATAISTLCTEGHRRAEPEPSHLRFPNSGCVPTGLINTCSDKIQELIASTTADSARRQDLATLKRLQAEFAAELATLRKRVDRLDAIATTSQMQQFSPTIKLKGEVIIAASSIFTGDRAPGQRADHTPTLGDRIRLLLTPIAVRFRDKDRTPRLDRMPLPFAPFQIPIEPGARLGSQWYLSLTISLSLTDIQPLSVSTSRKNRDYRSVL